MIDGEQAEGKETRSFFADVAQSLRSHFDERTRSPFAGAFLVAWVAVNWRPLFILLFSNNRVEKRISVVTEDHFSLYDLTLHPLWIAVLITIGFYIASLVFLVFLETYAAGRRKVEQWFDHFRWTSPTAYIELKRSFRDRNKELMDLAADNLDLLNAEKKRVAEVTQEKLELQKELHDRTTDLQAKLTELTNSSTESRSLAIKLGKETAEKERIRARLAALETDATKVLTGLGESALVVPITDQLTRPSRTTDIWRQELIKLQSELFSTAKVKDLLPLRLSEQSLRDYTKRRYPALQIDESLQSKLLADVHASKIPLATVQQLDEVVSAVAPAVEAYSADRSDLFKTGTDFLTKSLGFAFPPFRAIHGFSNDTMNAFSNYSTLIEQSGPPRLKGK